ncbi:hypothetical protein V2W45_1192990, partial [Cenococcum geophilum]
SYLIRFCNNIRAFIITSVTGIYSTLSCILDPATSLAFGIVSLIRGGGFYIPLSTLFRLNGNKPVTAHPAIIFLLVNALSRASL